MIFFARHEIHRQLSGLSGWLTALALFCGACFIIGWPFQQDLTTTRLVGPPSVWAFLVVTLYLALNEFWKASVRTDFAQVLAAQSSQQFDAFCYGRFCGGLLVSVIYTITALGLGSVLFAIEYPLNLPWLVQSLIASPAIGGLCLLTAALTARANGSGSALGVLILVPMLAPILIFSQVYIEAAQLNGELLVRPLLALTGLSLIYLLGGALALPAILRTQI